MEFAVLIGLALLVTAITARMSANRSHARLDTLERVVEAQRRALDELTRKLQATTPAPVTPPAAPAQARDQQADRGDPARGLSSRGCRPGSG